MTRWREIRGSVCLVTALIVGIGLFALTLRPVRAQDTVSATLELELDILNSLLVGLTTVTERVDRDYTQLFSSGTGANQANTLWHDERTLAASASETLDFNGSVNDVFGNSVACTALKALIVKADSGNTNDILVGGGGTTITSLTTTGVVDPGIVVRPNGVLIWTFPDATGAALTAGSADSLGVANSAGSTSVTYQILVLCEE